MSDTAPQSDAPLTPQQRYDAALAALTAKQRRFVVEYLDCLNAAEAARRAGYKAQRPDQAGYENLRKPEISAAVAAGLELYAMPSGEILARLARIARGSIADVLRLPPPSYEEAAKTKAADGKTLLPTPVDSWAIDLVKAQQTGAISLVRKIKQGEHGPEVELYSAHEALRDLAKISGLTIERIQQEPTPDIDWDRVPEHVQIAFLERKITLAQVVAAMDRPKDAPR